MEQWGGCNGYYVPPISKVCKVILHMRSCKAFGVLVIPYWQSAPFWPLICERKDEFFSLSRIVLIYLQKRHITLHVGEEMVFLAMKI